MGSDHCPVYADFLDELIDQLDKETPTPSPLLSLQYPEFSNKQQKLMNYFKKPTSQENHKRNASDDEIKRPNETPRNKKQKSIESFFTTNEKKNEDKLIQHVEQKEKTTKAWTSLFSAREIPRCQVHLEPCLERIVTKKGSNLGRTFYICSKPIGPKDAPAYQFNCNFFQWKTTK